MSTNTTVEPIEVRLRNRVLAPQNVWIGSVGISPAEAGGFRELVAEARRFVNEGHCAEAESSEDEPCYSPGLDDGGNVAVQWCRYCRMRVALEVLDRGEPGSGRGGASVGEGGMKALTFTQPWASLVAVGAKSIETRSWYVGPDPRGRGAQKLGWPIAIHAAKGFPREAMEFALAEPCRSILREHIATLGDLPRGAVIATAILLHVVTIEHLERAPHILTPRERAFGNYSPGRYAWRLWNVKPLPEPVPARGSLGLWEWDCWAEIEAAAIAGTPLEWEVSA